MGCQRLAAEEQTPLPLSCTSLSEVEQKSWDKIIGTGFSTDILRLLSALHRKPFPEAGNRENLQLFERIFDLTHWRRILPKQDALGQDLTTTQLQELKNFHSHWMFQRYRGGVQRLFRRREAIELHRVSGRFSEETISQVNRNPAAVTMVAVNPFECLRDEERAYFPCSSSLHTIDIQVSAAVFCEKLNDTEFGHLQFLVRHDNQGWKIIDVSRGHERTFLSAAQDLELLFSRLDAASAITNVGQWAGFFPSLVNQFNQFNQPIRLPASQTIPSKVPPQAN